MSNNKEIHYLRGTLFWPKIVGDPVPNYNRDGDEWTFDLALDADGLKQAKGIKQLTVKDKDDERGKFVSFKQKVRTGDGARPVDEQRIKVLTAAGNPWDGSKIGNGSAADVKFEVRDYGPGKYPGIYPRAVRILDHVAYEAQEFAPISEDDKFFAKVQAEEQVYKMSKEEDKAFKETFGGHTAPDDLDDDVQT